MLACPVYLFAGATTLPLIINLYIHFHRRSEPSQRTIGSEAAGRSHSDLQKDR